MKRKNFNFLKIKTNRNLKKLIEYSLKNLLFLFHFSHFPIPNKFKKKKLRERKEKQCQTCYCPMNIKIWGYNFCLMHQCTKHIKISTHVQN